MMNLIANVVGAILALVGIVGFFNNGMMGMNLNPLHDVILLIMGGVSLYFGIMGTEFQARYTMRTVGIILALVGLIGYFSGAGNVTLADLAGRHQHHLLKLIPRHLELGSADSAFNLILGIVGLIAGFLPRQTEIEVDMATAEARQKVKL